MDFLSRLLFVLFVTASVNKIEANTPAQYLITFGLQMIFGILFVLSAKRS